MRRTVAIAAGLAVLVGAILVLRTPPEEKAGPTTVPIPAPQTTVKPFAADGVVVAAPADKPKPPKALTITPGPQRLQVRWGPDEPLGAAGYDVRWGRMGTMEFSRLVSFPGAQLDALENTSYDIEVRTIDTYGQRSEPTKANAAPEDPTNEPAWSFSDRFNSRVTPDPVKWTLASPNGCGKATSGEGEDGRRLVISASCGDQSVALRARPPFRLLDKPVNGEFGRFVIETDQIGLGGILQLDLVPGPADLISGSPTGLTRVHEPAGAAADDPTLPPGAIRVWIAGQGSSTTDVGVIVAPGTPRTTRGGGSTTPKPPEIGFTVRWEVVFSEAGVQVVQDGVLIGTSNVVPTWREATALVGFVGQKNSVYAAVNLIGFVGAPTAAPVLVVPPPVDAGRVVIAPDAPLSTSANGARVKGAQGAQVRAVLLAQNKPGEDTGDIFSIEIGGATFPARPAIPGQPLSRGVRYPIVADVPAEALVLGPDGKTLPLRIRGPVHRGQAATNVVNATLELTAPEGAVSPAAGSGTDLPLPRIKPALPEPDVVFFNAAGKLLPGDAPVQRGRLVMEVRTNGRDGQRIAGRLAGLAGIEVRLDGERIAGIPTVVDGPGVGGRWRVALPTGGLDPGRHTIEVKAVGVDEKTIPALAYASFVLVD
ncbi:hypothetical protein Aglo02_17920 [Actinokineospora globicatena]|nr:hypothetical protein Aglo02_17920 [Actinokineospora globicatena]